MCVSAVNSRFGRILLVCRRLPVSKSFIGESESVSVPNLLAGDLTQNQVVSLELCDNKGGASFGLSQIGEGEGDDDDIAF